jgi:hypothetical protein
MMEAYDNDLIHRLRKRAEIRRSIKDRKSVQEGKPDRISDLLEEAADSLEVYQSFSVHVQKNETDEDLRKKVLDIWDRVEGKSNSSVVTHTRQVIVDRILPILKTTINECSAKVSDFSDRRIPASEYSDRLRKFFGVKE